MLIFLTFLVSVGVMSDASSLRIPSFLSIALMFNERPKGSVIVGGCFVQKLPEIHVENSHSYKFSLGENSECKLAR